MGNDNKQAVTLRINANDMDKFRELTELLGLNQGEVFQTLIDTYEMSKKKVELPQYQSQIEAVELKFNELLKIFIGILESKKTLEEVIREELNQELENNMRTISSLNSTIDELNTRIQNKSDKVQFYQEKNEELNAVIQNRNENLELEKENNIVLKEQLNNFNSIIDDYKKYKEIEPEIETIKTENNRLKLEVESLTAQKTFFEDQFKNMLDKYNTYFSQLLNSKEPFVASIAKESHSTEQFDEDYLLSLKKPTEIQEYLNLFASRYKRKVLREFCINHGINIKANESITGVMEKILKFVDSTKDLSNVK